MDISTTNLPNIGRSLKNSCSIYFGTKTSIFETLVGGFNPPEKYEFVSWDYYSQYMESHKSHVPNHQPDYINHIKSPYRSFLKWEYTIPIYTPNHPSDSTTLVSAFPCWFVLLASWDAPQSAATDVPRHPGAQNLQVFQGDPSRGIFKWGNFEIWLVVTIW